MKKPSFVLLAAGMFCLPACAQWDLGTIKKQAAEIYSGNDQPLSNEEVIEGLKEALTLGSENAAGKASKMDGFYKNPEIRIPFPPEAEKMKNKLISLGMEKQVNEFVVTLNRAAEEVAKESAGIFVTAVKEMSISDGFNILRGEDDAATAYLKDKTSLPLYDQFKPVVQRAIERVEMTKHWEPLVTTYNKIPFVEKMNPDLEDYVTRKAIAGLFVLIAAEELKIRKDPLARITDILKKVFGNNG